MPPSPSPHFQRDSSQLFASMFYLKKVNQVVARTKISSDASEKHHFQFLPPIGYDTRVCVEGGGGGGDRFIFVM